MDIIILNRDVNYSLYLMNKISTSFKEYRVIYIADNEKDFKEYIKANLFDVVIMEEYFLEMCPEIFKYNVYKIVLVDIFAQSKRYTAIKKESEKTLLDNLARILVRSDDAIQNARKLIRQELDYLGYNFSLTGTLYLEEAINLIYLKNCECNLEKEVYSQLSKTHTKTAHSIKVNIQNCIYSLISARGYNELISYLEIDSSFGIGAKPIICAVIDKVRKEV